MTGIGNALAQPGLVSGDRFITGTRHQKDQFGRYNIRSAVVATGRISTRQDPADEIHGDIRIVAIPRQGGRVGIPLRGGEDQPECAADDNETCTDSEHCSSPVKV